MPLLIALALAILPMGETAIKSQKG
jgi:hypothetical protein